MCRFLMVAVGACVWLGECVAEPDRRPEKPNFIFLFADDLGWGDLGCYGNGKIKTPNLDRLAGEGVLFTHGYVSSSVCSPSRAACLTGLFPARTGVHGHFASMKLNRDRNMPDSLSPEFQMLPRTLQEAGYETAHFGKWHLGNQDAVLYGFDVAKTANGGGRSEYKKPEGYYRFFHNSSERFVDDANAFMTENRNNPFYLQVWFLEPHAPNLPHDEFIELYKEPDGGVPKELVIPDPLIRYKAVVSNLDHHIGRLLDRLDELGLRENTVVVFSSDNGPEDHHVSNKANTLGMGEPGPFRGRKRSLYEGGVRVPFIVSWPGTVPAGAVDNSSMVGCVDLFPSFSALAGADVSGLAFDGEDIGSVLRGKSFNRSKPLFWEWRYGVAGHRINESPTHSVRLGKWKFYMNHDGSRKELYDVVGAPMEMDNVASENPRVVKRMEQLILGWRETLPEWKAVWYAGDNSYRWPQGKVSK